MWVWVWALANLLACLCCIYCTRIIDRLAVGHKWQGLVLVFDGTPTLIRVPPTYPLSEHMGLCINEHEVRAIRSWVSSGSLTDEPGKV